MSEEIDKKTGFPVGNDGIYTKKYYTELDEVIEILIKRMPKQSAFPFAVPNKHSIFDYLIKRYLKELKENK